MGCGSRCAAPVLPGQAHIHVSVCCQTFKEDAEAHAENWARILRAHLFFNVDELCWRCGLMDFVPAGLAQGSHYCILHQCVVEVDAPLVYGPHQLWLEQGSLQQQNGTVNATGALGR